VSAPRFTATAALVVMGLSGCALGPEPRVPEVEAPAGWSAQQALAGAEGPAPDSRWWQAFGDPVLDALVERALSENLDLAIARARVEEARAGRRAAGGLLLPRLDASALAQRSALSETGGTPGSELVEFGVAGNRNNVFQAGFDASWELDLFGANRRALEAATARWRGAGAERAAARLRLAAEVARTYLELRAAQRQHRLAGAIAGRQSRRLDLVRQRVSTGLEAGTALRGAESAVAGARAGQARWARAIDAALHRLAVLAGQPPAALKPALSRSGTLPAVPRLGDTGVPADLLGRRPDLRAAEHRLRAAAAEVGVALARLYPDIRLFGGPGTESDALGTLIESGSGIWSIGASLAWPVFQGGRLRAEVDAAEARLAQARLAFRQAVLRAWEDVETQLSTHRSARARAERRRERVAAAAALLRSAAARRDAGLMDARAVIAARVEVLRAEQAETAAVTDALVAFVGVYKALGGGWAR